MRNLTEYIKESNITNDERLYRNFIDTIRAKTNNNIDNANIKVERSSKGNWSVYNGDKKLFIVSASLLTDEVAEKYGLLKGKDTKLDEAKLVKGEITHIMGKPIEEYETTTFVEFDLSNAIIDNLKKVITKKTGCDLQFIYEVERNLKYPNKNFDSYIITINATNKLGIIDIIPNIYVEAKIEFLTQSDSSGHLLYIAPELYFDFNLMKKPNEKILRLDEFKFDIKKFELINLK